MRKRTFAKLKTMRIGLVVITPRLGSGVNSFRSKCRYFHQFEGVLEGGGPAFCLKTGVTAELPLQMR